MTPTEEMVRAAAEAIYNVWAKNREVEATWEECVRLKHSIAREAEEEGRAALSAALAAMQDHVIVPREPTLEMLASVDCWSVGCCNISNDDAAAIYSTMIAAAPSQLSKRGDAERDSRQEA